MKASMNLRGARPARVSAALLWLALAGCAGAPPAVPAPESGAALAEVLEVSLRLEAYARVCGGIDAGWQQRAAELETDWRGRHAAVLSGADVRYREQLQATTAEIVRHNPALATLAPLLAELPAIHLRAQALRTAEQAVTGARGNQRRDAAGQARICEFELARYLDADQDLRADNAARQQLAAAGARAGYDAVDLLVPTSGRAWLAGYRTGTSLVPVEKLLLANSCRNPAIVQAEEQGTNEVFVAACDNERRYVARCALRSCVLEPVVLPRRAP